MTFKLGVENMPRDKEINWEKKLLLACDILFIINTTMENYDNILYKYVYIILYILRDGQPRLNIQIKLRNKTGWASLMYMMYLKPNLTV